MIEWLRKIWIRRGLPIGFWQVWGAVRHCLAGAAPYGHCPMCGVEVRQARSYVAYVFSSDIPLDGRKINQVECDRCGHKFEPDD